MKKKAWISLVLAFVILTTMCVCPVSAAALNNEETNHTTVNEEDGWNYVEFTVPENYSTRTTFIDDVDVLPGEWGPGSSMKADGNYVTVAARGENLGITVSIQMKVKTIFNTYAPVTSIATLRCDGVTHNVFTSFEVEKGKTYRFFYKSNDTVDRTVDVFLSANFWNG